MNKDDTRMSIIVSKKLMKRSRHIPNGLRSQIIRSILGKIIDAGEEHGTAMYGALIDGDYDIVPRFQK
jgi:hypothetical protein